MDIVQLISSLISSNKSISNDYEIIINNEIFSFFEGINIIDCNKLSKDQYIVKCKDNIKVDANYSSIFTLFNILESKSKEKVFKYNFDLKDTTKTNFYIPVNISIHTFKVAYNELIKLNLPNTCQYATGFIEGLHYYHYFNNCYAGSYNYNQNLIKVDRVNDIEISDNYIIIRCCHDCIRITNNKITFSERDSYDNIICKILPCFNYKNEKVLIRFTPCTASFTYPISINFQLFDLMLYENDLYPYVYSNESDNLIKHQEKLVYTMNIFNKSLSYYQKKELFSVPIKINYNRLFGKYYTRYFNNKDKVLPVIADKDYCIENNIPYVQWKNNYYRSPENSGYTIILSTNKKYTDNNGIPKCVKVIRKYKEKREVVYFNITHELNEYCKGQFPSNLFISYGFELLDLYRIYFDIPEISSRFVTCFKCNTYISIPSQKDLVNTIKDLLHRNQLKVLNKNYPFNDINILSFSIDNEMNVYPYCVFNHVYSFDPSIPFLIVILNTSKLYTFPNYRYEFVVGPKDNWFNFKDDLVQAILSMYKKNSILIMDNTKLNKCLKQYVLNTTTTTTILIAEKEFPKENFYLWRSIYSEVIPKIPIIKNAEEFHNTLPSFSFLCKIIKNITAFHYSVPDENNEKFIVYGVWENEIYYPCKASLEVLNSDSINKPYLLIKRNLDGTVYFSTKNDSNFIVF
ncbi:hypothetical protein BCR36DRAFT_416805 [Piromyces finnis]|uniref:Uncharacterized protein n=1 Tax=Piromyces finnis TaxID=1754191 RepID=A0A1Y1UW14_9FUNG|nr:hypothetical protein BCR36DRAFT_416805 [Piromyces finnis]|eukprot:ORX41415.1 hypothetical protein BCR36DRAFT_416805 [Piromyces finnis]